MAHGAVVLTHELRLCNALLSPRAAGGSEVAPALHLDDVRLDDELVHRLLLEVSQRAPHRAMVSLGL